MPKSPLPIQISIISAHWGLLFPYNSSRGSWYLPGRLLPAVKCSRWGIQLQERRLSSDADENLCKI